MRINTNALSIASTWKTPTARSATGSLAQSLATHPNAARVRQGGPVQGAPQQTDLQKLLSAWGTSNATYDLTKDGVVDGKDLAIFLAGAPAPPQSAPPATTPDQVLESWGNPAGGGDLNGDGKVDGADLALSLGSSKPSAQDDLLAGVQKAWGTSNEAYDFNKDGTVDGTDLAMALSGAVSAATQSPDAPDSVATEVVNSVFVANDLNQDELLATDELPAKGAKLAATADTDGDGRVTRAELRDRIAQELSGIKARDPDVDVHALARRWLDSLLGTMDSRADARLTAARAAYGGLGAPPSQLIGSRSA